MKNKKWIVLISFLIFLQNNIFATETKIQTIEMENRIVSLDSKKFDSWQYCASPCLEWFSYSVPSIEKNLGKRITIRKQIQFTKLNFVDSIALNLGAISDKDKVYFDSQLIGSCGNFDSSDPECYDKIRIYEIPNKLLKLNQIHEIRIEVLGYFPDEIGITQYNTSIGPARLMFSEEYQSEIVKLIFLSIYSTVAFYFLFMFLFRTKEKDYFVFGIFVISVVIYQFLRTQTKYSFAIDFLVMKKIEYSIFTLMLPLFIHFIRIYFKNHNTKVLKLVTALSIIVATSFLFYSNIILYDQVNKNLIQPLGIVWLVYLFQYMFKSYKENHPDSKLMILSIIFLFFSLLTDILSDRGVFNFPRTFGFVFLCFILSIAMILAHKFVRLNDEVEELNESLEKKVLSRTEELNLTMKKIAEVKLQQDGDYFLTSLLLNPLTRNKNNSEFIQTEFYSKQKKHFEFKNKSYEIGGDISICTNITLCGKSYLVFVNGDAMGKSIQGAGGALVMGVIFNTVLARSEVSSFKNRSPERWLKDTFLELQKVFESFDGTMFLSCVIGLIDETTGFLYYINAEHPWSILYRDGISSFIEKDHTTRKLGIFENEKLFHVNTMNLKNGDCLFIGSDGRDDILVGISDNIRIINEDETIFLKIIQEAKGDLDTVIKLLHSSGELTDDCTIIKIKYIGPIQNQNKKNLSEALYKIFPTYYDLKETNFQENIRFIKSVYKLNPLNEVVNKQLSLYYFKNRDYAAAIRHIRLYTSLKPESTQMLYLESITNKKCGNYEKAVDIGEQILIRTPAHSKNIKNLKDLYRILNKPERINELELKQREHSHEIH